MKTITSFRSDEDQAFYIRRESKEWWQNDEITSIGFRSGNFERASYNKTGKARFSIEIDGIRKTLPIELLTLGELIKSSKQISELTDNWDELDAVKIEIATWERMALFLINYSTYVFNNFGSVIPNPDIYPCPDGSIDLKWRTKNARLLVNIKPSESKNLASYYGDLLDNKQAIKSNIDSPEVIDHFAYWMKNLS